MTILELLFGGPKAATPRRRQDSLARVLKETVEDQFQQKLAEARKGGADLDGALEQMKRAREARLAKAS